MQKTVSLLAALLLVACDNADAPPDTPPQAATIAASPGEAAYRRYCANCHDAGLEGAPVVGKRSDWDDRSQLWQAVVMEHAKNGYLEMPAKGGNPDTENSTIRAAAEYMLENTYPERPADQ